MWNNRNLLRKALVATVFALPLVQHAAAGTTAERTTYVTFSQSVQLPGVALRAGTYVFELAEPTTAPGVVRVLSRDRRTAYFLGFTMTVDRPRGMRLDAPVSLAESAAGVAPRITAWWPMGEATGHQFIFPRNEQR